MKKRILGIKISTLIIALVCLIAAFTLWLFVEVAEVEDLNGAADEQGACEEVNYNLSDSPEAVYEF